MDLQGRHVLITGTTHGIGRQLSLDLLAKGARITSIDRTEQHPEHSAWTSLQGDVRVGSQVQSCLERTQGPIDIVINNAGVMRRGGMFDSSENDFSDLVDTHVRGSWLVLKAALPKLAPDATIVQMASRHAIGLPENPALYGLTKRWVMDMAEVIGKTYPQFRVKILCPGPVDTQLTRVGTTPEELEHKKKMMCSVPEMSAQIIRLLEADDKTRLLFDMTAKTHFLV